MKKATEALQQVRTILDLIRLTTDKNSSYDPTDDNTCAKLKLAIY